MTVRECYEAFGGDYDDVLSRLLNDDRVRKYLGKFVAADMLNLMKQALAEENYEEAFRQAHSMKGVCGNLSMTALQNVSSEVTELLRGGKPDRDIQAEMASLTEVYDKTVAAVNALISEG